MFCTFDIVSEATTQAADTSSVRAFRMMGDAATVNKSKRDSDGRGVVASLHVCGIIDVVDVFVAPGAVAPISIPFT